MNRNYSLLCKLITSQRIIGLQRDLSALVTNIQTAADAKESMRRTELEEARRLRSFSAIEYIFAETKQKVSSNFTCYILHTILTFCSSSLLFATMFVQIGAAGE